jgi:type IV pilus assembly protein PilQ
VFPAAGPSVQAGTAETLSVDFPDEEVRTILRSVADLFELNLVVPDTLEGRASIKLRNVTWRQIFEVVLSPFGYTYIEEGNIIKVVSREFLATEPPVTEIFMLNHAQAGEVAPTIQSMVSSDRGGSLRVDARSNALVVTEAPSALGRIRPIIESLDRPTAQVMIETKFVEVTDTDIKNIGVNWASLDGYSVGAGPVSRTYQRETTQDAATAIDSLATLAGSQSTSRLTTAVFNAAQFNVVLSALSRQSEVRLVSNPTVVTLNNSEALISIGEQFPVPNYTYNPEVGRFEVSGFDYRDIGIILKVTPQVNNQGLINLQIAPEVSSRSGTVNFGGAGGAEIPIIASRRTATRVSIRDGYTMGLGGLIENTTVDGVNKVPVLGDVPGIGGLFRSKNKQYSQRNLLVFITARTLSPDGATYDEVFDPRAIRDVRLREDELPGYRSNVNPFPPQPEAVESDELRQGRVTRPGGAARRL